MGRISLFSLFFIFIALELSAQSGGYSNLEFVENKGQWDTAVRFRAELSAGAFFMNNSGFTVNLHDTADLRAFNDLNHGGVARSGRGQGFVFHHHAYRVNFVNANPHPVIVPDKPEASYNNYFLGSDRSKWVSNCRLYQAILYKDIYPGIDLRYYTNNGVLKYDLIVHPGADPGQIVLHYEGQDKLSLKKNQLIVKTSVSNVKELEPYSYQSGETGRNVVGCKYVLKDAHTVGFKLKSYASDQTLVIDPSTVFCSFTGSTVDNWGFTATYGPDGSAFMGGIVAGSGYPTSTGAYKTTSAAGNTSNGNYWDIGIIKLSPNGSNRMYATYLGGDKDEYPHSMIVDPQGNLIVLGRTYSSDFPLQPAGNQKGPGGDADIFVTKFNATGSALIGSMKIGGTGADGVNVRDQGEQGLYSEGQEHLESMIRNYGDWSRSEVILDGANNIYVAACTQSSNFPQTGNTFQNTPVGGQDGVVLKIDPSCSNLLFSAFLGGTGDDAALVLDLDPLNNDIYVGGATESTNFPGASANSFQPAFHGTIDGFVAHISSDGTVLKESTYLSYSTSDANSIDMIYGVKFDKEGFPYAMGTSTGTWPVKAAAYSNAGAKQFLLKLKPDLSNTVYSTVFGTTNATKPNISPVAFLVDRCENVYISGWGGWYSASGDPYYLQGTAGMPVTSDAIKGTTDNRDFYFIVLQRNAASLLYGTFFGEQDDATSISEHVDGGTSRYDKNGVIYEGICANCYRGDANVTSGQSAYIKFPTTTGAYSFQNKAGTRGCNMAVVKIAFNFSGVSAGLKVSLAGRGDSLGCAPLTVTMQDTVRNAKSYVWDFGDGSPQLATTDYLETHTYTNVGDYTITLIAIDPNSCNGADTVTRNVHVRNNKADLSFTFQKIGACTSLLFDFDNTSTPPGSGPPFRDSSFTWVFGDQPNTVYYPLTTNPYPHTFPAAGSYSVYLNLVDTNYCNYPLADTQTLYIAANVKAQFETPLTGCAPYYAVINNTSLGGQTYLWDFGDGGPTSNLRTPPPHLYPNPGTYTISLTVTDPSTCNVTDNTSITITVQSKPTAGYTWSPNPPVVNTPTVFTSNSSADAIRFEWIFGDGFTETKTTADTAMHQYVKTATYQACLAVFNASGCSDTACQNVSALINPLLDVPNAFTPGRFGQNSVVKVVGFGITGMVWRIYNRWGQMVFQSNDPNIGWDGTYRGVLQPMDVYAYTLEAEYSDGTHTTKKGDITLIR